MTLHTRRAMLLAAATSLLGAGCSRRSSAERLIPSASRILCVGDSLTRGKGVEAAYSYPMVLTRQVLHPVVNEGRIDESVHSLLKRLPELLRTHQPGLVLLCAGGCDLERQLPPENILDALVKAATLARESRSVVLIAQPRFTALSSSTGSVSDHPLYAEAARRARVPLYANAWSRILSDRRYRAPGSNYPNVEGYQRFAEGLAEWLRDEGYVL